MLRSMVEVNWGYAGDALPAAVTLLFIPFSYSVAYGLIAYVPLSRSYCYLSCID